MTEHGTNKASGATWTLTLTQESRDGTLVITVDGRLSAACAPRLATVFADAISGGNRQIVLDLGRLDYISSAGIMTLEAAAARLRAAGGELMLSGLTAPVRLALDLSGFPLDIPRV